MKHFGKQLVWEARRGNFPPSGGDSADNESIEKKLLQPDLMPRPLSAHVVLDVPKDVCQAAKCPFFFSAFFFLFGIFFSSHPASPISHYSKHLAIKEKPPRCFNACQSPGFSRRAVTLWQVHTVCVCARARVGGCAYADRGARRS